MASLREHLPLVATERRDGFRFIDKRSPNDTLQAILRKENIHCIISTSVNLMG
jgi:hypothetical protein